MKRLRFSRDSWNDRWNFKTGDHDDRHIFNSYFMRC